MVDAKTILVTGSNRGIGLELCRQVSQRGMQVIAACRSGSPQLLDLDVEIVEDVDVTSASSVQRLADRLSGRRLDWLVNNAGVLVRDSLENVELDDVERQFRVNSMGPLRVTLALKPLISKGGKVFVISSNMGSIEDNTSGGCYGYRMSKAAVNMAFKGLSVDLRPDGIGVFILHPGWVQTEMGGAQALISVEESVAGLIERMKELQFSDSGVFRHAKGYDLAW